MLRITVILTLGLFLALPAQGAEPVRLAADGQIVETGLLKFVVPRFSLKTGIKVALSDDAPDIRILPDGDRPLLAGLGQVFGVAQIGDGDAVDRFVTWLFSDIGQRTLFSFKKDGAQVFQPPGIIEEAEEEIAIEGDIDLGEALSIRHCGRCHVVSDKNKFAGIGSTPSFGALRTLPAWEDRFAAFWTLNPHPSFTQITDITEPFDPQRPPPIAPIELSLEEAEAIAAFAASIPPKNLGADIFAQ